MPDPSTIPAPLYDVHMTSQELSKYTGGTESGGKIYVAIKGVVYDVSAKAAVYGQGQGYSVFAGKDASCALGKSSLKPADVKADYSQLTPEELKVLDEWVEYFGKRYAVVATIKD